ncbi:MAG: fluoride efflux transporter CrcB [Alphaproteobacteria bacterium]
MNMLALAYVAFGGAVGAMGRHLMVNFIGNHTSLNFPYGTLSVNVLGGLLMGLWVGSMAYLMPAKAKDLHLLFAVGALGGFTTFSAFSLEIILLIERSGFMQAGMYVLSSVVLSVGALFSGMAIARYALG